MKDKTITVAKISDELETPERVKLIRKAPNSVLIMLKNLEGTKPSLKGEVESELDRRNTNKDWIKRIIIALFSFILGLIAREVI